MRFAFISVIGEHPPRRLSNFATTVFVIKASFYCVETPCSATVSSAWLLACAAFVEGVSCFIFFLHAHYISTAWVLRFIFSSHTHYLSIAWVLCLLFLSHTHYLSFVWVLHLLFLPHTHYNYLVKKRSRAYARLLKIQINSMNESKLLCYSSHCLIVILCSYPDIVLIWVLLLLK